MDQQLWTGFPPKTIDSCELRNIFPKQSSVLLTIENTRAKFKLEKSNSTLPTARDRRKLWFLRRKHKTSKNPELDKTAQNVEYWPQKTARPPLPTNSLKSHPKKPREKSKHGKQTQEQALKNKIENDHLMRKGPTNSKLQKENMKPSQNDNKRRSRGLKSQEPAPDNNTNVAASSLAPPHMTKASTCLKQSSEIYSETTTSDNCIVNQQFTIGNYVDNYEVSEQPTKSNNRKRVRKSRKLKTCKKQNTPKPTDTHVSDTNKISETLAITSDIDEDAPKLTTLTNINTSLFRQLIATKNDLDVMSFQNTNLHSKLNAVHLQFEVHTSMHNEFIMSRETTADDLRVLQDEYASKIADLKILQEKYTILSFETEGKSVQLDTLVKEISTMQQKYNTQYQALQAVELLHETQVKNNIDLKNLLKVKEVENEKLIQDRKILQEKYTLLTSETKGKSVQLDTLSKKISTIQQKYNTKYQELMVVELLHETQVKNNKDLQNQLKLKEVENEKLIQDVEQIRNMLDMSMLDYSNLKKTHNQSVLAYNVLKKKYFDYEGSSDEETWNEGQYDQTMFTKPRGKERKEVAKQFYESVNRRHGVTLKIKGCSQLQLLRYYTIKFCCFLFQT